MNTVSVHNRRIFESVWLKNDNEFEDLVEDEARMGQLVDHLRETQARFEVVRQRKEQRRERQPSLAGGCSRNPLLSKHYHRLALWLKPSTASSQTQSTLRTSWDLLQLAVLSLSLVFVPLRLAHYNDGNPRLSAHAAHTLAATELTLDLILALDIPIAFCTPYYNHEQRLVLAPREIFGYTLRRRLPLDLLVAFPLGAILRASDASGMVWLLTVLQVVRVLKAVRSVRSLGYSRYFKLLLHRLHPTILLIVRLLLSLLLTWLWLGCIWWYILTHDGSAPLGYHNGLWFVPAHDANDISGTSIALIVSFHWAASVTTCIGTPPVTVCTTWQAVAEALVCAGGVVMQSYFFGAAASAISDMDEAKKERVRKLRQVQSFIRLRDVPPFVGQRVIDFYGHMTSRMQPAEEAKLLEEVPATLRIQIAVVLNEKYLSRMPMFKEADSRSIALLALVLNQRTYLPNELVLSEGGLNDSLHFVRSGELQIFVRLATAAEGSTTTEPPLWGLSRLDNRDKHGGRRRSLLEGGVTELWARLRLRASLGEGGALSSGGGSGGSFRKSAPLPVPAPPSSLPKVDKNLGTMVATIREGAAFGEQSFLARTVSKASIRTVDFCETMALHRRALEHVFRSDPQLREQVSSYLAEQKAKYERANKEAADKQRRKSTRRLSGTFQSALQAVRMSGEGSAVKDDELRHRMRSASVQIGAAIDRLSGGKLEEVRKRRRAERSSAHPLGAYEDAPRSTSGDNESRESRESRASRKGTTASGRTRSTTAPTKV